MCGKNMARHVPLHIGCENSKVLSFIQMSDEIASNNYLDNFINWVGFILPIDTLKSWNKMQFLIGTNFWNTLYISEVI